MAKIDLISQLLNEGLSDSFHQNFQLVGEWAGRAIQWFKNISKQMQSHPHVAIAVFTIANVIFFTLISSFANALERRVHSSSQNLETSESRFNTILINGVVVGGATLMFNITLDKLLRYSLSKTALAIMTLTVIGARTLFNSIISNASIQEEDFVEVDSPQGKSKVKNKEAGKTKIGQNNGTEIQHHTFIHGFCQEIGDILDNKFQYIHFNSKQKAAQRLFLEQLKQGVAIIEDQADLCRAVNVSIQAAFEQLLCKKMLNGEITQADVLFLTSLPCTPLRTAQQEIDVTKKAEWKKWTVDIRTQTVRALRDANINVAVSYYATDYEALLTQSPKGQAEFDIYETEKRKPNIEDRPLSIAIPKELIGALYMFTDGEHDYILATQGTQIQQHGETSKESWKIWFGASDSPAIDARVSEVIAFIQQAISSQNESP